MSTGSDTSAATPPVLYAVLLAGAARGLTDLALRWVAVDIRCACRIAALACASRRVHLDIGAPRLDGPAHTAAEQFLAWLADGTVSMEDAALRIHVLDLACRLASPGTTPDHIVRAAKWLYAWFRPGRRPVGPR